MAVVFVSVNPDEQPRAERRQEANVVHLHLGPDTSVSMTREQWDHLRAQGGDDS